MSCVVKYHVNLGTAQIKNSQYEKLLGVINDTNLSFKTHVQQICGKANAKLRVWLELYLSWI